MGKSETFPAAEAAKVLSGTGKRACGTVANTRASTIEGKRAVSCAANHCAAFSNEPADRSPGANSSASCSTSS